MDIGDDNLMGFQNNPAPPVQDNTIPPEVKHMNFDINGHPTSYNQAAGRGKWLPPLGRVEPPAPTPKTSLVTNNSSQSTSTTNSGGKPKRGGRKPKYGWGWQAFRPTMAAVFTTEDDDGVTETVQLAVKVNKTPSDRT
jgi:hypothetical protein